MGKPNGVQGIVWQGTESDDVYTGTAGADSLGGRGGNDRIDGGAGNDRIFGHAGNDILIGGSGNDNLTGNEGNDNISGGDGDDYLGGQEGDDVIDGGAGNDFIGAGPGRDVLTGGLGADQFFFTANFDAGMNIRTITDFSRAQGDYIDLRSIDADGIASNNPRKGGNTDYVVTNGPSPLPGTAWLDPFTDPLTGATGVSIYLNSDADADPDDRIDVLGVTSLTWGVDILG